MSPNKRLRDTDEAGSSIEPRKRAFLQTMGQQLRQIESEDTSSQHGRRSSLANSPGQSQMSTRAISQPTRYAPTTESDAAPGDTRTTTGVAASALKFIWTTLEVKSPSSENHSSLFTFEDLLDWSQSYFDHWHPAFPFLDAPSLLVYFREVSRSSTEITGHSLNSFNLVILRSILSISAADRRQMETPLKALPPALVFHSYSDAISSAQLALTEESSILSLQALLSVQLFLITMHRYNAASRLGGSAVQIAFQLVLHKCPMKASQLPLKEIELRKRIFWSAFCLDKYISIRLGNPLGLRASDHDVCYPHTEVHAKKSKTGSVHDHRLDLLDFLARHANTRGSIMEMRNESTMRGEQADQSPGSTNEANHLKWWNAIDDYFSNGLDTQNITKAHQVTLIVLQFESVLAMNRSVLATSEKNSSYDIALQKCVYASRSIINTLRKAIEGFGAFDGSPGAHGYEIIPLLWPSYTWATWMSAFVLLFAATEGQIPRTMAIAHAKYSVQILKHIARRGTGWPEACILAIKNLKARLETPTTRRSSATIHGGDPQGKYLQITSPSILDQVGAGNTVQSSQQPTPAGRMNVPPASAHTLLRDIAPTTSRNSHISNLSAEWLDQVTAMEPTFGNATFYDGPGIPATYLDGSGTFLGIAQQFSDNPISNDDIMQLFGADDTASWMNDGFGFAGNF